MSRKKIIPFDVGYWLTEPKVRHLSIAARGLWVDMLCYMSDSSEVGVMLRPDGYPYDRADLYRISGSMDVVNELLESGLCGLRDDGAYYSPKMLKEAEISEKRRVAGKVGGDKTKNRIVAQARKLKKEQDLFGKEPEKPKPKPKKKDPEKIQYAEFVSLSESEFNKLCEAHGEMAAKRMIEILDNYKGSKGAKYKSDYRAILNWVVNRFNEENERHGNQRTTITGSAKQEANDYALQRYLARRQAAEQGNIDNDPKPF